MPRYLLAAVAALALGAALIVAPAAAQRPGGPPPGGPGVPAMILDEMSTRLNLTAAQKPKVKAILEERFAKAMPVLKDQSTPMPQKLAKLRAIYEPYNAKIKQILTPEQQKKYDQWQAELRQRSQRGPGGPPGGPPR